MTPGLLCGKTTASHTRLEVKESVPRHAQSAGLQT